LSFAKKIALVRARAFCCFAGVFEGGFEKCGVLVMVFCGDDRGGVWS
jgi:hypothetical protein